MNKDFLIRVIFCVLTLAFFLYQYINKQNRIVALRLQIPLVLQEVEAIKEEITRLQYEAEKFKNPNHLMELARRPEYGHLKQPLLNEIITVLE
jgi:hypothetical protein